ncbi:hypothetical protein SeMB42_g05958 [Synchytrium endobioticum]|uniref:Uncharacterized protein n=1 Tax=Synchytrium endobioticum TaxID=286115 RepID=A0A507CN43_9FUNG|nr:hypothetical protein SeMB42_g05958 [Synchytrium endobioticum]
MFASLFESQLPARRDSRLKSAKSNATRVSRELRRDRTDLERKEKHLLADVRTLVQRGEINRARTVASQLVHYRMMGDRNFTADAMIQTRAQVAASNHKINRAEIDALKGMMYANFEESVSTIQSREKRYAEKMEMFELMESIMNEGMDEIYDEPEMLRRSTANDKLSGLKDGPEAASFEREIDCIIRQAIEPGLRGEYLGFNKKWDDRVSIRLELYSLSNDSPAACTINIPTLEISASMLTHLIRSDSYCIKALGLGTHARANYDAALGTAKGVKVGVVLDGKWVPFSPASSLKECGVVQGGVVYVGVL